MIRTFSRFRGFRRFRLITRPENRFFRLPDAIFYLFSREIVEFKRWIIIYITIFSDAMIGLFLYTNNLIGDYTQIWYTILSASFTIIVATVVYDNARSATEKFEIKIRQNNDMFRISHNSSEQDIEYVKTKITVTIEEILMNIDEWIDEIKKWGKEKNPQERERKKKRCQIRWNTIKKHNEVLKNHNIVNTELMDFEIIQKIKLIRTFCDVHPEFQEHENICSQQHLEEIVLYSLLILKKWQISTEHRYLIDHV